MVEQNGVFEVESGVSGVWEFLRMVSGLVVVLAALVVAVWAALRGDTLIAQPPGIHEAAHAAGTAVEMTTRSDLPGTAPILPLEMVYYVVDTPESTALVRALLQSGDISLPHSVEVLTLSSPESLIALDELTAWGVHEAASQGVTLTVIDLRHADGR